ncbi:hypothetical protein ACH5RR_026035 [Cinchona calisaya]|uniref:Retrotransposon gag domain-containing protein n=1 Tax=Cinchona calisaya TaxID=153742 RepID=A0ABD2Z6C6_9GENT
MQVKKLKVRSLKKQSSRDQIAKWMKRICWNESRDRGLDCSRPRSRLGNWFYCFRVEIEVSNVPDRDLNSLSVKLQGGAQEPYICLDKEREKELRELRRLRRVQQEQEMIEMANANAHQGNVNMENEEEEVGGNNGMGGYRNGNDMNSNGRLLREYALPNFDGANSSIEQMPVQANNFEIKLALIQMLQNHAMFGGGPNEDPHTYLMNFEEVLDTFKFNGVHPNCVQMRVFLFSLRDRAKSWLQSHAQGTFTTWNQHVQEFLAKYFPPARTAN